MDLAKTHGILMKLLGETTELVKILGDVAKRVFGGRILKADCCQNSCVAE